MWCEPEFHRAGPGKMFMENKENESLKISAKLVDLEDAEEFFKKSAIGKEKIKIVAGDKKSEKVSMEVPEVLLNGNHKLINEYRESERKRITKEYRKDLL